MPSFMITDSLSMHCIVYKVGFLSLVAHRPLEIRRVIKRGETRPDSSYLLDLIPERGV